MSTFPIPDFPGYTADLEGNIYSNGSLRKKTYKTKKQGRAKLNLSVHGSRYTKAVSRLVLSAKLGRPLEVWEHACHVNGDPCDDHMDNLEIGCVINNAIDEVYLKRASSSDAQIQRAIKRLQDLLSENHGNE